MHTADKTHRPLQPRCGAVEQDVSGRKALRILACIPETALLTFCTGTLGYFHPVYSLMLPNCVGSTDAQNMEAGRWQEALRFSFEGSRGVGRPKVGTDWCGVSNPLLSRSSTPE
jgi:hypothetical protein